MDKITNQSHEQMNKEQTEELMKILVHEDPERQMAKRSGFIGLQKRLEEWRTNRQAEGKGRRLFLIKRIEMNDKTSSCDEILTNRPTRQFATLCEFFQSKSSLRKQHLADQGQQARRLPIQRLTKDDWNVRCWEARLRGAQCAESRYPSIRVKSQGYFARKSMPDNDNIRERKRPTELQQEVFNERIGDVATKLDKVRDGTPLDEELYRLSRNQIGEKKISHSFTDLLKKELINGTHDPKLLRSEVEKIGTNQKGGPKTSIKSPWGRPIRRILDEDDDDD